MRVITWNMGGITFAGTAERAWRQLLAWDPDVALVQEAFAPTDIPNDLWAFTPYRDITPVRGTLIYSKNGLEPHPLRGRFDAAIGDLVTTAYVAVDSTKMLFASIHAVAGPLITGRTEGLDVTSVPTYDGGQHHALDLILDDLSNLTRVRGSRFVVGGDLNTSVRFDDIYNQDSASKWFMRARAAKWRPAHPKFHAGEERTFFSKGRPDQGWYQLDHLFTDNKTWNELKSCDVLQLPDLRELSDHAPLALEW